MRGYSLFYAQVIMNFKNIKFSVILISSALFLISGCAPLAKVVVRDQGVRIPQIAAYLKPVLKDNTIAVLGKIVIQNPTESELVLDNMQLAVKDENNNILDKEVLEWKTSSVKSRSELESPVAINLSLSVLNNNSISIFIQTAVIYKTLDLRIPIESKIAVLDLDALKETITRPLSVGIYTKLQADILGNASISYVFTITNPLSINLILEDGEIGIYTAGGSAVAKGALRKTLFKGSQSNQIKGMIKIGNVLGRLIRIEFINKRPLRFRLSGKLKVANTNISMPFKVESVQEIAFSLFGS